jgi:hypothetical protein
MAAQLAASQERLSSVSYLIICLRQKSANFFGRSDLKIGLDLFVTCNEPRCCQQKSHLCPGTLSLLESTRNMASALPDLSITIINFTSLLYTL